MRLPVEWTTVDEPAQLPSEPMPQDALLLTAAQIEAAAHAGRLAHLAEALVLERSWGALGALLGHLGSSAQIPLSEAVTTTRATEASLARLPEAKSRRASVERDFRAVRTMAARSLLRRVPARALTGADREALGLARELLARAGEWRDAAELAERLGDDEAAAELYGRLGALERMEACLERVERRRERGRTLADITRRYEALMAAGERLQALEAVQPLRDDPDAFAAEGAGLLADADRFLARLPAPGTCLIRAGDDVPLRVAAAPATLGRDPSLGVPLREPSVSRRHASLAVATDGSSDLLLHDSGSRGGLRVGGARAAGPLALKGEGSVGLGEACLIHYRALGPGLVLLEVRGGLDRGARVLVGGSPLALSALFPSAAGWQLRFDDDGPTAGAAFRRAPRLERADASELLRLNGHLIGHGCDLVRGDVLATRDGRIRWEIL